MRLKDAFKKPFKNAFKNRLKMRLKMRLKNRLKMRLNYSACGPPPRASIASLHRHERVLAQSRLAATHQPDPGIQ